MPSDKIEVSKNALRQVLKALSGPSYLIGELQATRNRDLFPDNPINVLIDEWNASVRAEQEASHAE